MKSIPRLFPLFLLTICIGCLFSASVPGLLESLIEPLDSLAADADNGIVYIIFIFVFLLCGFLLILAVSEIIQVFSRKRKPCQAPVATSLLIMISIFFHIPARLHFYARFWEMEKALAQQSSRNKPFYFDTMSFERRNSPSRCTEHYGFAYIPNLSKAKYEVTHLHGKWYIFGGCHTIFNDENS
jgi:glucan phosphoethanolaminetransferase (alkaline phosphatase superfamily)